MANRPLASAWTTWGLRLWTRRCLWASALCLSSTRGPPALSRHDAAIGSRIPRQTSSPKTKVNSAGPFWNAMLETLESPKANKPKQTLDEQSAAVSAHGCCLLYSLQGDPSSTLTCSFDLCKGAICIPDKPLHAVHSLTSWRCLNRGSERNEY